MVANTGNDRRLLGLQLTVWPFVIIALVVGVAIGLVPWLVSGRLKIEWSWKGTDAFAWATLGGILATALGTAALAWSTRVMARSTRAMASSAKAQAKSTSDSVALQQDEFRDAQRDAWPEIRADVRFTDWQNVAVNATVDYIQGSQPAYAVEIVIRRPDEALYGGVVGTLAPMWAHDKPLIRPLPNGAEWPATIAKVDLTDRDYQFAATWIRTDRKPAYNSWVVRANGPAEWVSGSRDLRRTPEQ